VEDGGCSADYGMMRSGKTEDAVRTPLVRILRRYFDWGLSILVTEFETSHGAVGLSGWHETAKHKQQALYSYRIGDNNT
jgi:hypothetical protein